MLRHERRLPVRCLNVGTFGNSPSGGTQPRPDDAYLYSTWTGAYTATN